MTYHERFHDTFDSLCRKYGYPVIKEIAYRLANGANIHALSKETGLEKYILVSLMHKSREFMVYSYQRENPVRLVYQKVA